MLTLKTFTFIRKYCLLKCRPFQDLLKVLLWTISFRKCIDVHSNSTCHSNRPTFTNSIWFATQTNKYKTVLMEKSFLITEKNEEIIHLKTLKTFRSIENFLQVSVNISKHVKLWFKEYLNQNKWNEKNFSFIHIYFCNFVFGPTSFIRFNDARKVYKKK